MQPPSVKLAEAMTTSGKSLSEMSASCGLASGTLSRVANMAFIPTIDRAAAIAEAIGLRLELVDPLDVKPCGHFLALPLAHTNRDVKCRDCGRSFRWVPVEVEG